MGWATLKVEKHDSFGIADAILVMLQHCNRCVDMPKGWNRPEGADFTLEALAWDNGREQGYRLVGYHTGLQGVGFQIAFAEHRAIDQPVVWHCGDLHVDFGMDDHLENDAPGKWKMAELLKGRRGIDGAVDTIIDLVEGYLNVAKEGE